MLEIEPPNYQFCPFCGKGLEVKVEEGRERKFCGKCEWTYYPHAACAAAAVIVKDNKVLLVKRARNPYRGTWCLPAGFVDFGEHPEETLRREAREETGLKVTNATLFEVRQSRDDPRSPGHFVFFYRVEVLTGQIKTDQEENQEIGWFDLGDLPEVGWEGHRYILSLLRDLKN